MNTHPFRFICRLLPAAAAFILGSCGGGADGSSNTANIRLLNLSSGYESLDLYTNNLDSDTDTRQFTGVTRGTISSYAALKGDSYALKVRRSGTTGDLLSTSATLADDTHQTLVAHGATNQFTMMVIDEDIEDPDSGYTAVQVLNAASGDAFDVYLTGADDLLSNVSPAISGVSKSQTSSAVVNSGSYRLRITASGNKAEVRLNVPTITLTSKGVLTIILTESAGGVLVNAILLPKQGQPTIYDNTASAQVRVLNVSTGYSPIDLYTSIDGSDTETQQVAGVASGSATPYTSLKADTYALTFRKSGAAGNLLSLSNTVAEDTHVTLVAFGATNGFKVLPISEDVEKPDTGYTKLQILNASASESLDVYLTGAQDTLNDVSATVSSAAAGTLGTATTIRSGSYRLRITAAGRKSDVRLDVPAVALASQDVMSVILTEASGGVLISAVVLPQQGEPTRYDNTTVRIRGAVGLSTGAMVTVNVAGTDIVARRSARSYIADSYLTLPAGSVPVNVIVDSASVTSGVVDLEPGKDYTLLAWDVGGATRLTLIADDNHVPATNFVKLRLINGMSGLGAPLTLSVNYSPLVDFVELGTASDFTELSPGLDNLLDIVDSRTIALLLVRESVVLETNGVYTLFMAGGGSGAVVGTLRKDR